MSDLTKIRLRTLAWLIFPVTILFFVPALVNYATHHPCVWNGGLGWLGAWFILNGVGLAAWCVNLLNVEGQGTPLPLDPPTRFVATGPYRYVRNPMFLGALLILCGEAMLYRSVPLVLYAIGMAMLAALFVRCWEEPDLARRFGESYRQYQRQVPRWIPRPPCTPGGARRKSA